MIEYNKIKKSHIYETIAQQIREQIVSGKVKPGQKLPSTKELSESFQVGRSTVREALSALRAMGLIEIRQGEGSYVKSITPQDVEIPDLDSLLMQRDTLLELLEARKALEVANAGLSAEKRTEEDLQQLSLILDEMREHLGSEEIGEKMDFAFHTALARSTHNSIMVRLLESISGQLETSIRETRRLYLYADSTISKRLWEQHQQVLNAIADKNAQQAQQYMQEHLLFVEALLKQQV
ncbi:FadR/GntR family transcriptional regulator [Marinicrinis lubricantis]|uniref:FadR/GntR family transcriptional regulator n=1 Tax=Marinicrinis lubricantis TaxID=2086470 RepID=A0ABW1IL50_9BACL